MITDKSKFRIRRASVTDVEALVDARIQFLKEVQETPSQHKVSFLRTTLEQYFRKALKNETFISYIAEYENRDVAFSGMVIREQPGNFEIPAGKTGYILNMYTLKEFRKKGIGSMLFEKLISAAREGMLDKVELHATADGEPVYRNFGFMEPHDKALELKLHDTD